MKEKLAGLPSSPGVYLMKDRNGDIIYVGKSKNLRQRVQSYFHQSASHSSKVKRMVTQIRDLEIRQTDTEFEAFMLECKLIQRLRPLYNRKMKTPQAYAYLAIMPGEGARALRVVDGPKACPDGLLFGPYTAGRSSLERAAGSVRELLGLACLKAKPDGLPCLHVALGRCLGYCRGGEAGRRYEQELMRLAALLGGSDFSVQRQLEREMEQAAEHFDFEKAAKYRDGLAALRLLLSKQRVAAFAAENRNLVVVEELDGRSVKVFWVRRSSVLRSEKVDWTEIGGAEGLLALIREAVPAVFGAAMEPEAGARPLGREEIDEAQIIYSYLRSGAGKSVEIPDEWLIPEAAAGLEAGLRPLTQGLGEGAEP